MARLIRYLGTFIFCRCSCARCSDHDHCGSAACNTAVD